METKLIILPIKFVATFNTCSAIVANAVIKSVAKRSRKLYDKPIQLTVNDEQDQI